MNNSKMYRLILSGLEKDYKKSIRTCNKDLMKFVHECLYSIRNSRNLSFCNRVDEDIKKVDFFLKNYRWK